MGEVTADKSRISEAMRRSLGAVVDWRTSFPIAVSDIRRWCVATYFPQNPPRRFWDEEYAARVHDGVIAPEEFNPFAWMVAAKMTPVVVAVPGDPDRLEKAVGIRGPGLTHLINGGRAVTYGVPMRPGDVIGARTTLLEYLEREGRHGPMLITRTESRWTNDRDDLVLYAVDTSIRY